MAQPLDSLSQRMVKLRASVLVVGTCVDKADWDESKHPRDDSGQFSEGGEVSRKKIILTDVTSQADVFGEKKPGGSRNYSLPRIDRSERLVQFKVGGINVTAIVEPKDNGKHLHVRWVGDYDSPMGQAIGGTATRNILRALRAEFPEAETIGGSRVSGASGTIMRPRDMTMRIKKRLEALRAAMLAIDTCIDKGWDESKHPRADDGKFSEGAGGGARRYLRRDRPAVSGLKGEFRDRVEHALGFMPKQHLQKVAHVPVEVVEAIKPFGPNRDKGAGVAGFYRWGEGEPKITLSQYLEFKDPETKVLNRLKILDPEGIALHELAHVLDHDNGWRLGRQLWSQVQKDRINLKPVDDWVASQWLNSRREAFAELYAAEHDKVNRQKFNGLPIKTIRQAFATSLEKIRRVGLT